MPTAVPGASRRLRSLSLIMSAFALALALPTGARAAEDQFCYGGVKPIKPNAERDTGVAYEFSCRNAISGFALTSTAPIASFDVSADVFNSKGEGGALRGDDRFGECEGDLPGFGFRCSGTNTGLGRFTRASFDTVDSPCARDAARHVTMRVGLVVIGSNGKIGGPYELGKPKGCPKPKPKKAKRKKSTK